MPKLGINVGEEFPAEDVAPRSPEDDVWRERDAWREKAHAFHDDVRSAAHKHFGDDRYLGRSGFALKAMLGVVLIALAFVVIPHVVLLTSLAVALIAIMAWHGHAHYHDYFDKPRG